jgi:hypothetical protein
MHRHKFQYLAVLYQGYVGKRFEQTEHILSARKITARQFADHERMDRYLHRVEQIRQANITTAEMIYPNGSIH